MVVVVFAPRGYGEWRTLVSILVVTLFNNVDEVRRFRHISCRGPLRRSSPGGRLGNVFHRACMDAK